MADYQFTPEQENVIREWVKDLKSGDFRQTTGVLRSQGKVDETPSFCCLGVLCERVSKQGVIPEVNIRTSVDEFGGTEYVHVDYAGHDALLPPEVADFVFGNFEPPLVKFTLTESERERHFSTYSYDSETDVATWTVPENAPWQEEASLTDLNDTYRRSFSEIGEIIEQNWLKS